jgi:hypothetical protein
MTKFTRQIVVRILGAGLVGLATIAFGGSAAHAVPSLHPNLSWRMITDDPPADGGDPAADGADGSDGGSDGSTDGTDNSPTEAPAPESTASPAPAVVDGGNQSNRNDSGNDDKNTDSQSDDRSTADNATTPKVTTDGASPEPSETPQPRTVLVSEHGPSPLGWVLLAAGVICAGAAGAYYLRNRPFDEPEVAEVAALPPLADPLGPDTEELEAVPPAVDGAPGPDTEEMHIVPLGLDVPPRPDLG